MAIGILESEARAVAAGAKLAEQAATEEVVAKRKQILATVNQYVNGLLTERGIESYIAQLSESNPQAALYVFSTLELLMRAAEVDPDVSSFQEFGTASKPKEYPPKAKVANDETLRVANFLQFNDEINTLIASVSLFINNAIVPAEIRGFVEEVSASVIAKLYCKYIEALTKTDTVGKIDINRLVESGVNNWYQAAVLKLLNS